MQACFIIIKSSVDILNFLEAQFPCLVASRDCFFGYSLRIMRQHTFIAEHVKVGKFRQLSLLYTVYLAFTFPRAKVVFTITCLSKMDIIY